MKNILIIAMAATIAVLAVAVRCLSQESAELREMVHQDQLNVEHVINGGIVGI